MDKEGMGRCGSLVEKSTWKSEEGRRNYSAVTRIAGITVLLSYLNWKPNRRKANLVIFEGTCRSCLRPAGRYRKTSYSVI